MVVNPRPWGMLEIHLNRYLNGRSSSFCLSSQNLIFIFKSRKIQVDLVLGTTSDNKGNMINKQKINEMHE